MSSQATPGRPDQSVPAWLMASPAETARSAFVLEAVWCFSVFIWVAPDVFDNNSATTTIPLPNLIVWIGGLLALLTALVVGLLALGRQGALGIMRGVLFAAVLVGGVVSSIALVGVKVGSSTSDPNRQAHAFAVCGIALLVLACSAVLLGIRRKSRRP